MTSEGIEHKIVSLLGQQKVRSLTDIQQQYAAKIGQTLLVLGFFAFLLLLLWWVIMRKGGARVAQG